MGWFKNPFKKKQRTDADATKNFGPPIHLGGDDTLRLEFTAAAAALADARNLSMAFTFNYGVMAMGTYSTEGAIIKMSSANPAQATKDLNEPITKIFGKAPYTLRREDRRNNTTFKIGVNPEVQKMYDDTIKSLG